MREKYRIVFHTSKELIRICSIEYGAQLWALTNQVTRKNHKCGICGKRIHRGKDKAYRPLTNLGNRMDRICLNCGNEKED